MRLYNGTTTNKGNETKACWSQRLQHTWNSPTLRGACAADQKSSRSIAKVKVKQINDSMDVQRDSRQRMVALHESRHCLLQLLVENVWTLTAQVDLSSNPKRQSDYAAVVWLSLEKEHMAKHKSPHPNDWQYFSSGFKSRMRSKSRAANQWPIGKAFVMISARWFFMSVY